MNPEALKSAIRQLITEIAEDNDVDLTRITDEALFVDDLGFDSMAVLEVIATMEKTCSVSIPEAEYTHMISIAKCAQIFHEYLSRKGA